MEIISFINKKGGVGKTTSVGAFASIFAGVAQKKVLVVDLDPQCNVTELFGVNATNFTIRDLLLNNVSIQEVVKHIHPTTWPGIDIIPGDPDLDEAGDLLLLKSANIIGNRVILPTSAQTKLTAIFKLLEKNYDLILIDNTPYFNLITKNALSASSGVLIPLETDGYSYRGLIKLIKKIVEVKSAVNSRLDILGVFVTRANKRTAVYKDLIDVFTHELGNKMMHSSISNDNKVKESNTNFIPLYYYSRKGKATKDYIRLILELNLFDSITQTKLKKELEE